MQHLKKIIANNRWLCASALFIAVVALLSYFLNLPGEIALMLYACVALFARVPARQTVLLAQGCLGAAALTLVLFSQQNRLSSALASYAFILLATSVFCLVIEQWKTIKSLVK